MKWNSSKHPLSPFFKAEFLNAIATTKEHITAGDIFQLVLSQRFERRTFADPFEIYRALRVVNPSPYMVYMQTRSICIGMPGAGLWVSLQNLVMWGGLNVLSRG